LPTARPVGITEIVSVAGVVLLSRVADNQLAPPVDRVNATEGELVIKYCTGAGTEPPI
jgi:hypothetical protein